MHSLRVTRETAPQEAEEKLTPFGRRLREAISRKFRTKKAFLQAMGIDAMTVYRWEVGQYMPQLATLQLVAKTLDVTTVRVLGRQPRLHTTRRVERGCYVSEQRRFSQERRSTAEIG